jgi:uncharacterized protein (TIGR00251 family)
VRVEILVRPNALRDDVGGDHDGALVVRVSAPAEKGRATRAALRAVAESFGVSPGSVTLVRGPTSRRKIVEIKTSREKEAVLQGRLRRLLQDEG